MKLAELPPAEIKRRLRDPSQGLCLRTGPYTSRIVADSPFVDDGLQLLYGTHTVPDPGTFIDFNVRIHNSGGLRRWWRKRVAFSTDGVRPFAPLPAAQAYPLLEWALNWCLSSRAHDHLNLHAAALERGGRVLILPAPPGSGKSTLCAGLTLRGWRLLSDELALLSPRDGQVTPLVRAISLKNASIDVIRAFDAGAVLNEPTHDTVKGTVSHMQAPAAHVARAGERANPRWVVFPKYVSGAAPLLTPRSKADSLLELGRNAFNYSVLGLAGFETLSRLVDACDCYDFSYGRLDDAARVFEQLARTAPEPTREAEAVAA
ncbi:MAG: HprK-related kinase A [Pseudomonadota bacterium]|nr:HprK-related kinase A [Pseudomonadota bacterium]